MVWSSEPDAMCFPSGENTTEVTGPQCPSNGSRMGSAVSASHRQTVLSRGPQTMRRPSGEKAMEEIELECPSSGFEMAGPASASQIRMVLPQEPETMRRPSGEHATEETQLECPHCTTGIRIPERTTTHGFSACSLITVISTNSHISLRIRMPI
jgi:hypothetical protein